MLFCFFVPNCDIAYVQIQVPKSHIAVRNNFIIIFLFVTAPTEKRLDQLFKDLTAKIESCLAIYRLSMLGWNAREACRIVNDDISRHVCYRQLCILVGV